MNTTSAVHPTPLAGATPNASPGPKPSPSSLPASKPSSPFLAAKPNPESNRGSPTPHYASVYNDEVHSSDEERTHMSVLSRRLRKRRKTNSSLVSNPFGTPAHRHSDPTKLTALGDLDDLDDELTTQSDFRRRKPANVPESDIIARQRCFEYLHTAIDALWAEYCDSTSYAESLKYMPHSPVSEQEDSAFLSSGDERTVVAKFAESLASVPSSASHGSNSSPVKQRHQRSDSISMQPQSQSLMRQKKRLVDAKYYLSHFVGLPDPHSSSVFWRVWDQLKDTAVELVEGDDEDFEEVVDDLEAGRFLYA